jgi:hypothetical protein
MLFELLIIIFLAARGMFLSPFGQTIAPRTIRAQELLKLFLEEIVLFEPTFTSRTSTIFTVFVENYIFFVFFLHTPQKICNFVAKLRVCRKCPRPSL